MRWFLFSLSVCCWATFFIATTQAALLAMAISQAPFMVMPALTRNWYIFTIMAMSGLFGGVTYNIYHAACMGNPKRKGGD